jgi:hypothetical protein
MIDDDTTPTLRRRSAPKPNRPRLAEPFEEALLPVEQRAAEAYTAAEDCSSELRDLAFAIEDPAARSVPELIEDEEDSLAQALRVMGEWTEETDPGPPPPSPGEYSIIKPRWSKPRGKR